MKLHEILAVEGQLKGQAEATRKELVNTFQKKRHLFEKKVVTFQPTADGTEAVTEQQSDLQSKVVVELDWIAGIWRKALDTSLTVADGNTQARADVTLESGTILLRDVPATALLELEKRGGEIKDLIMAIPTLDPAKGFRVDEAEGVGVYRALEVRKERTRKTQRPIVLYPATTEHPAQTQLLSEDVVIGRTVEQEWSGLVTPAQKGDLLERAEEFLRAVKQARMRANSQEITQRSGRFGEAIFAFVFHGQA